MERPVELIEPVGATADGHGLDGTVDPFRPTLKGLAAGFVLSEVKQRHRGEVDANEQDAATSFNQNPEWRVDVSPRLADDQLGRLRADGRERTERVVATNHVGPSEDGGWHSAHLAHVDLSARGREGSMARRARGPRIFSAVPAWALVWRRWNRERFPGERRHQGRAAFLQERVQKCVGAADQVAERTQRGVHADGRAREVE